MRPFLIFSCLFVLISCQDPGISTLSIAKINSLDNISIPIDSILIDGGQLVSFKERFGNTEYLYRTRPFANGIQSINLGNGDSEIITIPKEGPNGIRRIQSFIVKDDGSYLVAADEKIVSLDTQGRIIDQFRFFPNNMDMELHGPYIIRATHEFPLQEYKGDLVVHLERDDSDDYSFPFHYQGPFLGLLDIEKRIAIPLSVEWPDQTQYYGFTHQPFFSVVEEDIVYGFAYSPHIYRFSLESDLTQSFYQEPFKGLSNDSFKGSFDEVELLSHRSKSVVYGEVVYDEESNRYCQLVFVPPVPSHPMYGKAQFIGVRLFDENLTLIGEETLPGGMAPEAYFFNGELFVRFIKDVPENALFLRRVYVE